MPEHIPVLVSLVIMCFYYYAIYGKFTPFALSSVYISRDVYLIYSLKHAARVLASTIFDRITGTFPTTLHTLRESLVIACRGKIRRKKTAAFVCLPALCCHVLFLEHMGRVHVPARQMVPVLLVAGYYAAYFMQEKDFAGTGSFRFFTVYSVAVSYVLMIEPALRYFSGREKIYAEMSKLKFNLLWLFPSFEEKITLHHLVIIVYSLIIVVLFFKYSRKTA